MQDAKIKYNDSGDLYAETGLRNIGSATLTAKKMIAILSLLFFGRRILKYFKHINRRIQTRSATPVDSVNEGGVLRAVDQQFSVHSQR
jgi:hypothetical protein